MKRKILSLILVVAMLASMAVFTPAASAAESKATLAFGNAAGTAGDVVTVEFTVTTDVLDGIQFMFEYDTARLTYKDITWTSAFGAGSSGDLTNGDNKVFTSVGPYKILFWGKPINTNPTASEGVVMATLTFTINEDAPLGDAYVKFAPLAEGAYQPNKINSDIVAADMTFVDGVVTVLPEGSPVPVVIPVEDLAIEDGYVYEVDESWADYPGVLTIPADAGIEGIDYFAFNGFAMCGFVIPENVVEVVGGAFNDCNNLAKVYVLNESATLDKQAIGFSGTAGRRDYNYDGKMILNDNSEALTTIYGVANSTAETYAATGDGTVAFPFVAAVPEFTVTVGDVSYAASATTRAPGVSIAGGKTVIGWTTGDATYAAGAEMTLTGDVVLEPVTITAPVTSTDADFKIAASEADLALRFTSSMSIADYEALVALGTVKLGMLITPAAYVAKAGSFTKEALDGIGATNGAYVDVAVGGYYEKTKTDYIFAGSLKGFSATTLAKNPAFASVLYATVTTAEGDTFTVYGTFNFAANQKVKDVAEGILDSNPTYTQKEWLAALVEKFDKFGA